MTTALPTIRFNVSGVARSTISGSELMQRPHLYDGSPEAVRAGEALNTAAARKMGSGYTYLVTCDVAAAAVIRDYCETVGQTFVGELDAETKRDGRALLAVAERIRLATARTGWTPEGKAKQEPVLLSEPGARREKDRRNAAGEVATGHVAIAQPFPPDAWGGEEDGWLVVEVPAPGGGDPVRDRRNLAALKDSKHWSDRPTSYALMGSIGEPVRTHEDMRLALSGQLQRYLNRFPDPAGPVDDALAYRTASLIVGDHYVHPCSVMVQRGHLLDYVELARARQQSA